MVQNFPVAILPVKRYAFSNELPYVQIEKLPSLI